MHIHMYHTIAKSVAGSYVDSLKVKIFDCLDFKQSK